MALKRGTSAMHRWRTHALTVGWADRIQHITPLQLSARSITYIQSSVAHNRGMQPPCTRPQRLPLTLTSGKRFLLLVVLLLIGLFLLLVGTVL